MKIVKCTLLSQSQPLTLITNGDIGSKWGDDVKAQAVETMRDVIVSMANDE
jgi:hypothetical protein